MIEAGGIGSSIWGRMEALWKSCGGSPPERDDFGIHDDTLKTERRVRQWPFPNQQDTNEQLKCWLSHVLDTPFKFFLAVVLDTFYFYICSQQKLL